MPSESFTHSARAAAPSGDVWAALNHPKTWENIAGIDRVLDPKIDDEGRLVGFSFDSAVAGKSYRGSAKPDGREEGLLMAWAIENSEISGRIKVTLEPDDNATSVHVTLDVSSKGMLSSMFFPVVAATVGAGLPRSVDAFAAGFG